MFSAILLIFMTENDHCKVSPSPGGLDDPRTAYGETIASLLEDQDLALMITPIGVHVISEQFRNVP